MSTRRKSPVQSERDPDVAGAETALQRAATRAMERAERVADIAVSVKSPDKDGSLREVQVDCTPVQLSFSQAQGYEETQGRLKLGELPKDTRIRIWNLFFVAIDKCKLLGPRRPARRRIVLIAGHWVEILKASHLEFHNLPLDDWNPMFEANRSRLREYIQEQPFNQVFDLIQFVLRHPRCPPAFIRQMQRTFAECGLAYTIDVGPPPTILPAVTPEEGDAVVGALRTLREARLHGSATHLRAAAENIKVSEWAGSVRESIHAVESVARLLDSRAERKLGAALAALEKRGVLHPALKEAFSTLYGYTSDEQGIRHALLDRTDAQVGRDEAVFMLGACAAFASYLWRRHAAGASG